MEGSDELKAGHAPAQKVGGMRVVQRKHSESSEKPSPAKAATDEEKAEFGTSPPKKAVDKTVFASGAKVTEDQAFPTDAVKAFHDKPQPTVQKNTNAAPKIIQQPRK